MVHQHLQRRCKPSQFMPPVAHHRGRTDHQRRPRATLQKQGNELGGVVRNDAVIGDIEAIEGVNSNALGWFATNWNHVDDRAAGPILWSRLVDRSLTGEPEWLD